MKLNNFWHNVPRNLPDPGGSLVPTPDPAPVPDPSANPAPAAPDYSFIPTDFHKDGAPDIAGFSAHYQELIARDAQRAEADAAIPETYEFGLPEGFTFDGIDGLPDGFEYQLTPDDPKVKPLYDDLAAALKEARAPAGLSKQLMGILARYQAIEYADAVKSIEAEMKTLGSPSQITARVGTVERALETRLPADEAAALKATLRSPAAIKAVEKLLTPSRTASPAPGTPPGVDTSNMTAVEKLRLANAQAR